MLVLDEIRSLSDFMRNAKSSLQRLHKSGHPELLTVNGKASVIIQDATAYQKMIEDFEEARTFMAIHQGIEAAKRGEGMPVHEAFARVRQRIKQRRKK